jgi:hypothetical protein
VRSVNIQCTLQLSMHDCKCWWWAINVIHHQVLQQNHQYKQKAETVYVNSMRLLVNYVSILFLINKLQFYFLFCGSMKYMHWIIHVSQFHAPISPQLPLIIEHTLCSIWLFGAEFLLKIKSNLLFVNLVVRGQVKNSLPCVKPNFQYCICKIMPLWTVFALWTD